jgi:hypothetical protein
MAGFYPYRTTGGQTGGEVYDFIIEDSATITIGDAVDLVAGYIGLTGTGADARSIGVVLGFGKLLDNGEVVPLDQDAAGSVSGTRSGNAGVPGSETYVAASDNITVDQVTARVIVDPNMQYYNDASGTLTQAMVGTYFDMLSTSDQIDISTTATYSAHFILLERDPFNDADLSKGIFKLVEHQLTA